MEKPKFALPDLDDILHDDPGDMRACMTKSAALIELGHYSYALRFLNRTLDSDPENCSALTNRAICYFFLGKKELAEIDFKLSLAIQPTVVTLLARGKCHLAEGQFYEALADVKSAILIDAKAAPAYYLLGEIELGQSQI